MNTYTNNPTKRQLANLLSLIDGKVCNPNSKDNARHCLARRAHNVGLTLDELLAFADAHSHMPSEAFQSALSNQNRLLDAQAEAADNEAILNHPNPEWDEAQALKAAEVADAYIASTPEGTNAPKQDTKAPRRGTKKATLLAMLTNGATTDELAEALGWQRHTVRGAISLEICKRMGLTVDRNRISNVGPNAKGSTTHYRIAQATA